MELKIVRTAKVNMSTAEIETLIRDALKHQHPKVKVQRVDFNISGPYPMGGVHVANFVGASGPTHYLVGATVHLEVEE